MKRMLVRLCYLLAMQLGLASAGLAQVKIQIESQGVRRIPIAIEPFFGEPSGPQQYSQIIVDDLARTGLFRAVHTAQPATEPNSVPDYDQLLAAKHEYLLVGLAVTDEPVVGETSVTFQLFDLITRQAERSLRVSHAAGQERITAHIIANWLFEQFTGEPGIFQSKIAYILKTNPTDDATFELKIADYDGYTPQTLLISKEPIISPEWTDDGEKILYVSYEQNKPIVYEHTLLTGVRRIVAAFKGNNSAPSISPDQRWFAVALSEEGNTQIFLISVDGTRKLKLRNSNGIDTEPDFSPNNEDIAFVSDAGGSPQIYLRNRLSGQERRLTFGSSYNVSPRYNLAGTLLTYVRRDTNGFNVHMMDPDAFTPASEPLTGIDLADSPSFSPDGRLVLFKNDARPDILYTVALNGKIVRPLSYQENGEIKDPTWGPASSSWY